MAETRERILVIKLGALGDFILALRPMAAIRKHHPDAHIALLTTRGFVDLGAKSGLFDEIHETKRFKFYELGGWLKLRKWLNASNFTRVYDFQLQGRSKLIYRLFSGKKPEWLGVIPGNPLFYDNPDWRKMHASDRHAAMLKLAGIDEMPPADYSWMDADISHFDIPEPFVLFAPGSAPTRPDKRWPAMRYAALAKKLQRNGLNVAVLGTNDEKDAVEKIIKACPDAIDLSGKTSLTDIAALARRAGGAVCNDTGPAHIIAASGCPTLALFASRASNPEYCAPRGDDVKVILVDDLEDLSVDEVMQEFTPRKAEAA